MKCASVAKLVLLVAAGAAVAAGAILLDGACRGASAPFALAIGCDALQ